MNNMYIARSLTFYPGFFEDNCQELSDEIIMPSYYLNRLIDQYDDGEMLYATITNDDTNKSALVAIGSGHTHDKNTIFAPQWILDLIDCTGCCDSVIKIKKADVSEIPVATKIVIKPLDPIAFDMDTLSCFEKALINLHSIKEGITIPIHVPELGKDYVMFAHIEKVEPAGLSRIVQGEVDVEFINEFNKPHNPEAISAPEAIIAPEAISQNPYISASADMISTPMIPPYMRNSNIFPITPSSPTSSASSSSASSASTCANELVDDIEERRRVVRESWLKRYQLNNTKISQ